MSVTTETLLNQLMAECGDTSPVRRVCHLVTDFEAERDALRERCERLEWLVEVQEFVVYFDPTSTLDNACVELAASWKYAELCAAIATEVK